jgi:uncharacterized membrane protein (UPF0127 family)
MKKYLYFFCIIILTLIVGYCFYPHKTILVELATTPKAWEQGLSGRDSLAPETGMLFIFDQDGPQGIWMKDMKFAIDILWLDEHKRVIHKEERVAPETYPKVFTSASPARYVLELPAGEVAKDAILLGQDMDGILKAYENNQSSY